MLLEFANVACASGLVRMPWLELRVVVFVLLRGLRVKLRVVREGRFESMRRYVLGCIKADY